VPTVFLFIQYADCAKHVAEGKYVDKRNKLRIKLINRGFRAQSFYLNLLPSLRFFTARLSYASAVLRVVIMSVCLTVLLSVCHTRALRLIRRSHWRYFIPHKRAILVAFCYMTVVGGRRPVPPLICNQSDPPPSKISHVDRFPPVKS